MLLESEGRVDLGLELAGPHIAGNDRRQTYLFRSVYVQWANDF